MKNKQRTIEYQGEKQVNALKSLNSLKPKEVKPKEIKPVKYSNYFVEGLAEIQKNNPPIDFNNLTFNFKDPKHAPISFIKFKGPNRIFKTIHDGDIFVKDVEKEQEKFKSDIGEIKKGNPMRKSPEQIQAISNIENLCKSREEFHEVFNDFGRNMSEKIYKSKYGKGLKILTPKKCFKDYQ